MSIILRLNKKIAHGDCGITRWNLYYQLVIYLLGLISLQKLKFKSQFNQPGKNLACGIEGIIRSGYLGPCQNMGRGGLHFVNYGICEQP